MRAWGRLDLPHAGQFVNFFEKAWKRSGARLESLWDRPSPSVVCRASLD